ncbi:MAG: polyketide cyclase [Pseudonocardiaceae bacterium]|nr:polyketide cyclase [Pseudonocardiaceae bacterium]
MSLHHYRFRNSWFVATSAERVFTALTELGDYPLWWPHVREVNQVDDNTAEVVCRAVLPYALVLRMVRVEQDESLGRLGVRLSGDLEGSLRGLVQPRAGGTRVEITQQVVANKKLLRRLTPVARPAFLVNHALMMRRGQRGLRAHLTG